MPGRGHVSFHASVSALLSVFTPDSTLSISCATSCGIQTDNVFLSLTLGTSTTEGAFFFDHSFFVIISEKGIQSSQFARLSFLMVAIKLTVPFVISKKRTDILQCPPGWMSSRMDTGSVRISLSLKYGFCAAEEIKKRIQIISIITPCVGGPF